MNSVQIVGRLTRDPQIYENVTKFTVAVDKTYKKEGEDNADFFNVACFGNTKKYVDKYIGKGRLVSVVGSIHQKEVKPKEGNPYKTYEIAASSVEGLEKAKARTEGHYAKPESVPTPDGFEYINESIPF